MASTGPYASLHLAPDRYHSVFYRPDALPAAQPTASKHIRHQPASDVNHKPDGRLPLLSARPGPQLPPQPLRGLLPLQFCCLVNRSTMGVNSLPKTVTRQRRDCELNPGPSAPESSTLTTLLPSQPANILEQTSINEHISIQNCV